MAYSLSTQISEHVIEVQLQNPVTRQELRTVKDIVNWLVSQSQPPVHVLLDHSAVNALPVPDDCLKEAILPDLHPHLGWICFIVNDSTFDLLVGSRHQLWAFLIRVFASRLEALTFLHQADMLKARGVPEDQIILAYRGNPVPA